MRPFGYSPDRAGSWTRADALAYAGFLATVGGVLLAAGALVQARLKHLLLVVGLVLLGISLLLAMFVVPFLHPREKEDDLREKESGEVKRQGHADVLDLEKALPGVTPPHLSNEALSAKMDNTPAGPVASADAGKPAKPAPPADAGKT
ncbi:MAG TPA: hypothetical protein DHU96_35180 [Actinobacteria bacterium]|nr:hypothetical protein [Actinomycetota bacterium]